MDAPAATIGRVLAKHELQLRLEAERKVVTLERAMKRHKGEWSEMQESFLVAKEDAGGRVRGMAISLNLARHQMWAQTRRRVCFVFVFVFISVPVPVRVAAVAQVAKKSNDARIDAQKRLAAAIQREEASSRELNETHTVCATLKPSQPNDPQLPVNTCRPGHVTCLSASLVPMYV